MELLTQDHVQAFRERFPLGSQEGQGAEALVVLKLFHPTSRYTLFVTEGAEYENGDWTFFGFAISALGPDCDEWGYTCLRELKQVRTDGLGVERDIYFPIGQKQIQDVLPHHVQTEDF
jgi:hypothetical protein